MQDQSVLDKTAKKSIREPRRHLFGPIFDFLGLGGASLIALLLFLPFADFQLSGPAKFIGLTIVLSTFVNHAHFAHSYQIFYREFRRKISDQTPAYLRYRYWIAGIIVPILMAFYFAVSLVSIRPDLIGYGANAMALLVGWHYMKQGYGMLSVDAVLKKKFFSEPEKKILIWNAYAMWLFFWTKGNRVLSEREMLGLEFFTLDIPDPFFYAATLCAIVLGLAVMSIFARRILPGGKGLALNGAMAYLVTAYIWFAAFYINPLITLFIPAFHSLQYMTVVNRFQLNVEQAKIDDDLPGRSETAKQGLIRFYLIGMFLGIAAFLLIPFSLSAATDFESLGLTPLLPVVAIWLFINIHHYFLDNVMWRKGNPDVGKHLFAQT